MTVKEAKNEIENLLRSLRSPDNVSFSFLAKRPETSTALEVALQALTLFDSRSSRDKETSARKGKLWRPEEDEQLSREFDEGRGIEQLSRNLGRSPSAVYGRLQKLGKLNESDRID